MTRRTKVIALAAGIVAVGVWALYRAAGSVVDSTSAIKLDGRLPGRTTTEKKEKAS